MTTAKRIRILSLTILTISLFSVSCAKKSDQDKIAEAQSCMDSATSSSFQECVNIVEGMESKSAYTIRCIGKFVEDGFNESTRLSTAMSNMSGSGSSSQSLGVMAVMAFTKNASMSVNSTNAQLAVTYCSQGNSKGLVMLSMMSSLATTAAYVGSLTAGGITAGNLATAMSAVASDPVAAAAVGTAVLAAYTSNCTNGGTSSAGLCSQLASAVGSNASNPTAIGQLAATCYANPAATGCTGY